MEELKEPLLDKTEQLRGEDDRTQEKQDGLKNKFGNKSLLPVGNYKKLSAKVASQEETKDEKDEEEKKKTSINVRILLSEKLLGSGKKNNENNTPSSTQVKKLFQEYEELLNDCECSAQKNGLIPAKKEKEEDGHYYDYFCFSCSDLPICKYCFLNCHTDCFSNKLSKVISENSTEVCSCALVLGHRKFPSKKKKDKQLFNEAISHLFKIANKNEENEEKKTIEILLESCFEENDFFFCDFSNESEKFEKIPPIHRKKSFGINDIINEEDKTKKILNKIYQSRLFLDENKKYYLKKYSTIDTSQYIQFFEKYFEQESKKYEVNKKSLFIFSHMKLNFIFRFFKRLTIKDFNINNLVNLALYKLLMDSYFKSSETETEYFEIRRALDFFSNKSFQEVMERCKKEHYCKKSDYIGIVTSVFKYYINFGLDYFLFDKKTLDEIVDFIHQFTLNCLKFDSKVKTDFIEEEEDLSDSEFSEDNMCFKIIFCALQKLVILSYVQNYLKIFKRCEEEEIEDYFPFVDEENRLGEKMLISMLRLVSFCTIKSEKKYFIEVIKENFFIPEKFKMMITKQKSRVLFEIVNSIFNCEQKKKTSESLFVKEKGKNIINEVHELYLINEDLHQEIDASIFANIINGTLLKSINDSLSEVNEIIMKDVIAKKNNANNENNERNENSQKPKEHLFYFQDEEFYFSIVPKDVYIWSLIFNNFDHVITSVLSVIFSDVITKYEIYSSNDFLDISLEIIKNCLNILNYLVSSPIGQEFFSFGDPFSFIEKKVFLEIDNESPSKSDEVELVQKILHFEVNDEVKTENLPKYKSLHNKILIFFKDLPKNILRFKTYKKINLIENLKGKSLYYIPIYNKIIKECEYDHLIEADKLLENVNELIKRQNTFLNKAKIFNYLKKNFSKENLDSKNNALEESTKIYFYILKMFVNSHSFFSNKAYETDKKSTIFNLLSIGEAEELLKLKFLPLNYRGIILKAITTFTFSFFINPYSIMLPVSRNPKYEYADEDMDKRKNCINDINSVFKLIQDNFKLISEFFKRFYKANSENKELKKYCKDILITARKCANFCYTTQHLDFSIFKDFNIVYLRLCEAERYLKKIFSKKVKASKEEEEQSGFLKFNYLADKKTENIFLSFQKVSLFIYAEYEEYRPFLHEPDEKISLKNDFFNEKHEVFSNFEIRCPQIFNLDIEQDKSDDIDEKPIIKTLRNFNNRYVEKVKDTENYLVAKIFSKKYKQEYNLKYNLNENFCELLFQLILTDNYDIILMIDKVMITCEDFRDVLSLSEIFNKEKISSDLKKKTDTRDYFYTIYQGNLARRIFRILIDNLLYSYVKYFIIIKTNSNSVIENQMAKILVAQIRFLQLLQEDFNCLFSYYLYKYKFSLINFGEDEHLNELYEIGRNPVVISFIKEVFSKKKFVNLNIIDKKEKNKLKEEYKFKKGNTFSYPKITHSDDENFFKFPVNFCPEVTTFLELMESIFLSTFDSLIARANRNIENDIINPDDNLIIIFSSLIDYFIESLSTPNLDIANLIGKKLEKLIRTYNPSRYGLFTTLYRPQIYSGENVNEDLFLRTRIFDLLAILFHRISIDLYETFQNKNESGNIEINLLGETYFNFLIEYTENLLNKIAIAEYKKDQFRSIINNITKKKTWLIDHHLYGKYHNTIDPIIKNNKNSTKKKIENLITTTPVIKKCLFESFFAENDLGIDVKKYSITEEYKFLVKIFSFINLYENEYDQGDFIKSYYDSSKGKNSDQKNIVLYKYFIEKCAWIEFNCKYSKIIIKKLRKGRDSDLSDIKDLDSEMNDKNEIFNSITDSEGKKETIEDSIKRENLDEIEQALNRQIILESDNKINLSNFRLKIKEIKARKELKRRKEEKEKKEKKLSELKEKFVKERLAYYKSLKKNSYDLKQKQEDLLKTLSLIEENQKGKIDEVPKRKDFEKEEEYEEKMKEYDEKMKEEEEKKKEHEEKIKEYEENKKHLEEIQKKMEEKGETKKIYFVRDYKVKFYDNLVINKLLREADRTNHRKKIESLLKATNEYAFFYLFQGVQKSKELPKYIIEVKDMMKLNKINLYIVLFVNVLLMILYYQRPSTPIKLYGQNAINMSPNYKYSIQIVFCLINIAIEAYFIALYIYNFYTYEIYDYFNSQSSIGLLIPKIKGENDEDEENEENEGDNEKNENIKKEDDNKTENKNNNKNDNKKDSKNDNKNNDKNDDKNDPENDTKNDTKNEDKKKNKSEDENEEESNSNDIEEEDSEKENEDRKKEIIEDLKNGKYGEKTDIKNLLSEIFMDVTYNKYKFYFQFLTKEESIISVLILISDCLYLIFRAPLFLILPIILLVFFIEPVRDVFTGLQEKFVTLVYIFLYNLVMLYVLMWIAFSFFSIHFSYEVVNNNNEPLPEEEPFCYSSFQCLLTFWSKGLFGSGTSDMTNLASFKEDTGYFMIMFLYNFLAFIIINTIFSNIFTGLITDAFSNHREKTEQFNDDRENLCFVCDYHKEDASVDGVNFNEHIKLHGIHRYIEFLVHLFLKDQDDFTLYEKIIYDQIMDNDISWVPYRGRNKE